MVRAQTIPRHLGLKAGEWVEVRSRQEILSTLDKNGRLEELPFMPQMLDYCGRRFQVYKHVHKVCSFATRPAGNKMSNAVNLKGVQCNGEAYGGCEAQCIILWKEAWLKRADQFEPASNENTASGSLVCSENDIWAGTRARDQETEISEPVYVCQATQIPKATQPLSVWAFGQYYDDYVSGNAGISKTLSGLLFQVFHHYIVASGLGFGSVFRWAYDQFQFLRGGIPYPWRRGQVPRNSRTPTSSLNLQVGELVRVKSYKEILKTLDDNWKNRGLNFHAELSIHCGKTFRVLQRPKRLIDEKSGRLVELKNECIVLEGANCEGKYTNPLNCPRASYPYYREVWLERVAKITSSTPEGPEERF
jgi:hypothetical protein